MKYRNWILSALAVGGAAVGCSRNAEITANGTTEIAIDLGGSRIDMPLSELYDSVNVIPLETSDESLIGVPSVVALTDSLIFVGDRSEQVVRVFDNNGYYLRSIGSIGQGPGEYLALTQIDYNSDAECLLIFDRSSGNVVRYTCEGEYISTDTTGCYGDDFAYSDGRYLFIDYTSTAEGMVGVYAYNPDTKDSKKISDWEPEIVTGAWVPFSRNNGRITIPEPLPGADIYEIAGDTLRRKYSLKISPTLTIGDLRHYRDARGPVKLDSYMLQSCVEADSSLFLTFYNGEDFIRLLIDKATGKYKLIQSMPYDLDENKLAGLFPIHHKGARVGFVRKPDSDDNPMLALFHYKPRESKEWKF